MTNEFHQLLSIAVTDLTNGLEEAQKFAYDNNGNQLYTRTEKSEKASLNAKPSFGMFITGQSYVGESAKTFFESNMTLSDFFLTLPVIEKWK